MMTIADKERYQQHRNERVLGNLSGIQELWLTILLFGSMGAITWAIRGTAGWGGVDGTVVPGLMWGLLWYYMCWRKGIDARGLVFWLGLGLALGGELGYGQYVSWIRGFFNVGNETIPIAPRTGYIWLVYCGIGWAAPGGILLGWALGGRASMGRWLGRSLLMIPLFIFLFAWPVVDWVGAFFARVCPGLLFPHADLGLYSGQLDNHLSRTVYTNTQNFAVVVWWVVSLVIAAIQRDKATLFTGLLIGGGFGIGFMQSTLWCLGYGFAPGYIDWWKMWELNAGFNLGLLYAITLYWTIWRLDKKHHPDGAVRSVPETGAVRTKADEWIETLFLAIGGFLLLFFMGFEYFFWTGTLLSLFYFVAMCLTTCDFNSNLDFNSLTERRKSILLTFSVFLLVFLMCHGGSERAGILLELYQAEAVDQYAWPAERIALFVPVAAILVGLVLVRMWHILRSTRPSNKQKLKTSRLPERMVDLMTGMGFIGALSIWPAKIGVIYALVLVFAIYAYNRLNYRFNAIDTFGSSSE